jgi:hypothetical protein
MPSCFVEEQLTQRRERRVGHVPQSGTKPLRGGWGLLRSPCRAGRPGPGGLYEGWSP